MKRSTNYLLAIFLGSVFTLISFHLTAQTSAELTETARKFTRQGDYGNAILVLNRAVAQNPKNLDIQRELALNYYLQRDFKTARTIITPLVDKKESDVMTFQVAANIFKGAQDIKELEKLYKKGLKKFPDSGPLNAEYGELLYAKKDFNAIKYWEKGIAADPSYPMNYYHAAKYYYLTQEKILGLLFAETFINLESYTSRTLEMKNILLDGYKKLFAQAQLGTAGAKRPFSDAVLEVFQKQAGVVMQGVQTETLSMVRTRFILQWFYDYGTKYPYKLFEYQQQLLRAGLFEAYNQWIFTAASNLTQYQNWQQTHAEEAEKFALFQQSVLFKVPDNQFYK